MPLCLICLVVVVALLPVGLLLRKYSEIMLGRRFNWVMESKTAMRLVWKENAFVWLLLALEGIIANGALIGFIVGIPLYFWIGI